MAGVRFDEITVLGNTFKLARPDLVPISLWLLWGYFGLRYYQLFRALKDPEPREAWIDAVDRIALNRGEGDEFKLKIEPASNDSARHDPNLYNWSTQPVVIGSREWPTWRLDYQALGRPKDPNPRTPMTGTVTGRGVKEIHLSKWDAVRAGSRVALHTRFFTEYGLPAVIAVLPLIVGVVLLFR